MGKHTRMENINKNTKLRPISDTLSAKNNVVTLLQYLGCIIHNVLLLASLSSSLNVER
jgi:hypothetical protein